MTSLFDRYLQESDAFSAKNKSPELSRATRCFKFILIFVNLVFVIFACALIGVGSVAYNHNLGPLAGSTIPLGILVCGVFILLIAFCGFYGAYKESRLVLGCFLFWMVLFIIILLAIGLAVYAKRQEAGWYIEQGWIFYANNGVRVSIQNAYGCCGLLFWNVTAGSPCPAVSLPANVSASTVQPPCYLLLTSTFANSLQTVGGVGIGFAIFMLVLIVMLCGVMRAIRKKSEMVNSEGDNMHTGDDSANPSATIDASV